MRVSDVLFSLIRFSVYQEKIDDKTIECLDEAMILELYELSKAHDLAHLVADALLKLGKLSDNVISQKFKKQKIIAIYRSENIDFELSNIKRVLKNAKIPFVALKGSRIKKYYPENWMRTSCDIDILVNKKDLERAIDALKAENWQTDGKINYHDISLYSPSKVHLELHFSIRENMTDIDDVLDSVWQRCNLKENEDYEFEQTNEFLLFQLICHMAYHFVSGGCGIRTFMDIWILQKNLVYDEDELASLCESAKLEKFYANVVALTDVWFKRKKHTDITKMTEEFVLSGGVYGNKENKVALDVAKAGGKAKNILNRIFMPYNSLKIKYPVLEKKSYLTPIFWVVRWKDMFLKGKFKRSVNEYVMNNQNSDEKIKRNKSFLEELGLL